VLWQRAQANQNREGCAQSAASIADLLAHPGALPPAQAGVSKRVAQPGGSVLFSQVSERYVFTGWAALGFSQLTRAITSLLLVSAAMRQVYTALRLQPAPAAMNLANHSWGGVPVPPPWHSTLRAC
jgi:hypothetical protein